MSWLRASSSPSSLNLRNSSRVRDLSHTSFWPF